MSCSGASETGSVPRGCFGQLASTRHVVPPHLRSKSILLSSFLHSSCFPSTQPSAFRSRIGRSHRRVGVRGLRGRLSWRADVNVSSAPLVLQLRCTAFLRHDFKGPVCCDHAPVHHYYTVSMLLRSCPGLLSGAVG